MNLRIITHNCQSFKCNIDIIRDLFGQCDILFLQETLLNDYEFMIFMIWPPLTMIFSFMQPHPFVKKAVLLVGRVVG